MAEIKYKYAYDENGDLVSIDDLTKETSKLHTYHCVGCGNQMLPRAIGSQARRAHFYHKELVTCSGETYLHRLAKKLLKEKFDTSEEFNVSYWTKIECNNDICRLRHNECFRENGRHEINLKQQFDTCTEEAPINGFIADLLLTNSKDPSIAPVLIEVCVSHACEEEKLNSGLQIIEIKIRNEQDVISLMESRAIKESDDYRDDKKDIRFISFERVLKIPMETDMSRYIFTPERVENGYLKQTTCRHSKFKMLIDSACELNILCNSASIEGIKPALVWMYKHKHLRRCTLCKFYYVTSSGNTPICLLSKKLGRPKFPRMTDAETCSDFIVNMYDIKVTYNPEKYIIEEVVDLPPEAKEEYRVIIAGSRDFDDYNLFKEKCDYYLRQKMKSHRIVILAGTSRITSSMIYRYAHEHDLIVEPHNANWGSDGQKAAYLSNEEMVSSADGLIAFWDGDSLMTKALIDSARRHRLRVAQIDYWFKPFDIS